MEPLFFIMQSVLHSWNTTENSESADWQRFIFDLLGETEDMDVFNVWI